MSEPLGAEPWQPGDPEFKKHQASCFICNHDGQPSKDAYRPHALDASCWCISDTPLKKVCKMAKEWDLIPRKTERRLTQCGLSARVIAGLS